MKFIEDLKVRCGGTENYDYYGGCNFKRNKRDIVKEFKHIEYYGLENEPTLVGVDYDFILKEAYGYNKALVYTEKENPEHEILVSYNTIVAERIENEIKINGWYSRTTAEHINAYLGRYTGKTYCKKDLEKEPVIEWY